MTLNELLFKSASLERTEVAAHRPDGSVILMAPNSRTDWDIARTFQDEHAVMTPEEVEAKWNKFEADYQANDWSPREETLFRLSCSDYKVIPANEYTGEIPDNLDRESILDVTFYCGRAQAFSRYASKRELHSYNQENQS